MKIGTENKTKTIVAAVLLVFAAVMLYRWLFPSADGAATATPNVAAPRPATNPSAMVRNGGGKTGRKGGPLLAQTLDPTLRFDLLKSSEDVTYKGSGRDIFRSQPEPPPIPKPLASGQTAQTGVYAASAAANQSEVLWLCQSKDGNKRIFLSQGEDIFVAKEGQVIDRRYKIVKINPTSVDVEDVLTNNRQTLPLVAG